VNDVLINKTQSIQRCIRRVREEYSLAGDNFKEDYTRQDAAILNLTRACEQAIDLANHIIKAKKLGIPTKSSDSFALLSQNKLIPPDLSESLIKMTGFRNTAVHQYQELDMDILVAIIEDHLDELTRFTEYMLDAGKD
jgi:uncharacterized protein YutE (UPF0331/DUF86 family)